MGLLTKLFKYRLAYEVIQRIVRSRRARRGIR